RPRVPGPRDLALPLGGHLDRLLRAGRRVRRGVWRRDAPLRPRSPGVLRDGDDQYRVWGGIRYLIARHGPGLVSRRLVLRRAGKLPVAVRQLSSTGSNGHGRSARTYSSAATGLRSFSSSLDWRCCGASPRSRLMLATLELSPP